MEVQIKNNEVEAILVNVQGGTMGGEPIQKEGKLFGLLNETLKESVRKRLRTSSKILLTIRQEYMESLQAINDSDKTQEEKDAEFKELGEQVNTVIIDKADYNSIAETMVTPHEYDFGGCLKHIIENYE